MAKRELKARTPTVREFKNAVFLGRDTNQARGIAQYAIDFLAGKLGPGPDREVLKRVELFHTDSVICGISALALGTNSPSVLLEEALEYKYHGPAKYKGATAFGSEERIMPEKAVVVNSSAVREWDSNGTVFGYNKELGHIAGEFGHNDFYPVVIAACQMKGLDGNVALRAMVLLDEIRGRLAEVFALKNYKIDHVVHGAIASAATYGALMGATVDQIESAIGMCIAHYIPWRAIRAGHQLSDSKGASAAISTEVAILSVHRSMRGFVGPADVFRNPEAIFRYFTKTTVDASPFDLVLTHSGNDFSVMGMHFKCGLYEHQSAGALQGVIDLVRKHPVVAKEETKSIQIVAYQPAFGIIGDPAKRDPHTRQSADHSMVYIVATMFKKAVHLAKQGKLSDKNDELWKQLMLTPEDFSKQALFDKETRAIMERITFAHGGKEYDDRYPDGIPTSVVITTKSGTKFDSGLIMYPAGHARNTTANLESILNHKFTTLAKFATKDPAGCLSRLSNISSKSAKEIDSLYNIKFTAEKSGLHSKL